MSKSSNETKKLGRNDPCHCNSGKKYKKCHLTIDEEARQLEKKKEQEVAAKVSKKEEKEEKEVLGSERIVKSPRNFNKNQNQKGQGFRLPRRSNG